MPRTPCRAQTRHGGGGSDAGRYSSVERERTRAKAVSRWSGRLVDRVVKQAPTPSHQWLSAADGWGDSRMSQVYWGSRASEPLTIVGGWSMKVALRTSARLKSSGRPAYSLGGAPVAAFPAGSVPVRDPIDGDARYPIGRPGRAGRTDAGSRVRDRSRGDDRLAVAAYVTLTALLRDSSAARWRRPRELLRAMRRRRLRCGRGRCHSRGSGSGCPRRWSCRYGP